MDEQSPYDERFVGEEDDTMEDLEDGPEVFDEEE